MARVAFWLAILTCGLSTELRGQGSESRYTIGMRSAVIVGTIDLSSVDSAFDDLDFDGITGPHISGLFFHYAVRPHLRIGFETLAANSDGDQVTTMNYQAGGPVVELSYGDSWLLGGGIHVGGLIANAMVRQGAPPPEGASSGSFYKGEGGFLSPFASFGRRFDRNELRLLLKPVVAFGDGGDLSGFTAWFAGLSYGRAL
jgi:hypothetical protein